MIDKRHAAGITLVELMIVIVIIGVLAAIGYPSYQSYTQKTRRTAAQAELTAAASQQEQFFLNMKTYAGAMTSMNMPTTTEGGFYNLAVDSSSATTYTLSATPTGTQTDDSCGTMTLTKGGVKTPASDCWE
jgi:type IV pilus assembly protein PilE